MVLYVRKLFIDNLYKTENNENSKNMYLTIQKKTIKKLTFCLSEISVNPWPCWRFKSYFTLWMNHFQLSVSSTWTMPHATWYIWLFVSRPTAARSCPFEGFHKVPINPNNGSTISSPYCLQSFKTNIKLVEDLNTIISNGCYNITRRPRVCSVTENEPISQRKPQLKLEQKIKKQNVL